MKNNILLTFIFFICIALLSGCAENHQTLSDKHGAVYAPANGAPSSTGSAATEPQAPEGAAPATKDDILNVLSDIITDLKTTGFHGSKVSNIEGLEKELKAADNGGLLKDIRVYSSYAMYKAGKVKPRGSLIAGSIAELLFSDGERAVYMIPLDGTDAVSGDLGIELAEIMRTSGTVEELTKRVGDLDVEKNVSGIHVYTDSSDSAKEVTSGAIGLLYSIKITYNNAGKDSTLVFKLTGKDFVDPDYMNAQDTFWDKAEQKVNDALTVEELSAMLKNIGDDFVSLESLTVSRYSDGKWSNISSGELKDGDRIKVTTDIGGSAAFTKSICPDSGIAK